jgi:hypothetical protein
MNLAGDDGISAPSPLLLGILHASRLVAYQRREVAFHEFLETAGALHSDTRVPFRLRAKLSHAHVVPLSLRDPFNDLPDHAVSPREQNLGLGNMALG